MVIGRMPCTHEEFRCIDLCDPMKALEEANEREGNIFDNGTLLNKLQIFYTAFYLVVALFL